MNSQLFKQRTTAVGSLPGVSLLLAGLAIVIYLSPALTAVLQYDRNAIASGEVWRIVTCQWTHWSVDHLFWDVAVFAFVGAICEIGGRRRFLYCLLAGAVMIPLSVWFMLPGMVNFRGLSGLDAALCVLLAASILKKNMDARGWPMAAGAIVFLIGFLAKVSFEVVTGTTVFVDSAASNMIPVPLAHLVGACAGVALGLVHGKGFLSWAMPAHRVRRRERTSR